jgi:hypothetical protein
MRKQRAAKRGNKPKPVRRAYMRSQRWRKIEAAYGSPPTDIVRGHLREGLTVTESAGRILRETRISVNRATLYAWLAQEAEPGRPLVEAVAAAAK